MTDVQKEETERFNPMAIAPATPTGPSVPRTAASILQMAGREDASKWEDRAARSSSPEEELEEVKVEATPAEPEGGAEAVPLADFSAEQPTEETDVDTALHAHTTAEPETEPEAARPEPLRRTRGAAAAVATGPSTPKIMLRFNSPAVKETRNTRAKVKTNGRKRGRKAKASDSEGEAEESEDEAPAPKRRGRAAPPPPAEGVRRSLRSRAPKNAEQQRQEEEKRARLREALASDDEVEDEY